MIKNKKVPSATKKKARPTKKALYTSTGEERTYSRPIKLNLGCGPRALNGFVNVDKYYTEEELKEINPQVKRGDFLQADILKLPLPDSSVKYIETIDMIEHLKMQSVVPALKEWFRVLEPEGELMVLTIDFTGLAKHWIKNIGERDFNLQKYVEWSEVIYGTQADDGQYHKTPFTKEFMELCLRLAGFTKYEVRIVPRGQKAPPEYRDMQEGTVVRSDMLVAHAWK